MAPRNRIELAALWLLLCSPTLIGCSDDSEAEGQGGADSTSTAGATATAGRGGAKASGGQAQGGAANAGSAGKSVVGATGGAVPSGVAGQGGGVVTAESGGQAGATSTGGLTTGGTIGAGAAGGAGGTAGALSTAGGMNQSGGVAGSTSTGGSAIGSAVAGSTAAGATAVAGTAASAGSTAVAGNAGTSGYAGNSGTAGSPGIAGNAGMAGAAGTTVTGPSCDNVSNYYRLDEGTGTIAHDSIGTGDGSLVNAPAWTSGKLLSAVEFNGSNHIAMADSDQLDPGVNDFSVEAWVKIPAGAEGQRRIVAHGTHGGPGWDGYSLMEWCAWGAVPCGGMGLLVGQDSVGEWLVGTCTSMSDGQWHHYAATVDRSGKIGFAVDGVLLASPCTGLSAGATWGTTGATDISVLDGVDLNCPCPLCLGASCQSSGSCSIGIAEPFTGSLDEVAFYHRTLSDEEIAAHYASGAGANICQVPTCQNGLLDSSESDVDCGSNCTEKCAGGMLCSAQTDCASGDCESGHCLSLPIAYYAFDETTGSVASDTIGGHDGVRIGDAAPLTSGCKRGNCLQLSGSGNVQVTSPTWLPVGNAPRSVSMWINPGTDLAQYTEASMLQYGTAAGGQMFGLITSGNAPGKLYFYGHNADLSTSQSLTMNAWQHIAVSYDGSNLRLYVGGQLGGSANLGLGTVLDANGLTMGLRPPATYFTGMIDEVKIYDRAIDATEVLTLSQ